MQPECFESYSGCFFILSIAIFAIIIPFLAINIAKNLDIMIIRIRVMFQEVLYEIRRAFSRFTL